MRDTLMVRCAVYRGGTSKGVLFRASDLPPDAEARAGLLLAIFGSPDTRQIDGLGGANSQTSKAMIVASSKRADADVESTFARWISAGPWWTGVGIAASSPWPTASWIIVPPASLERTTDILPIGAFPRRKH